MPDATVYSLLLQAYHADKSAARLLQALQELAGRLEAVEGSVDAGLRLQEGSCHDLSTLQLPDPARGPLPLLPGSCEHQALQAAAEDSSRVLRSAAERRAWRSWLMSPQHMVHVVEAAWLLVALVFRQDDACAAALQVHVCQQIQSHHVSTVLAGQEVVEGCSQLWTKALADAACRLLRSAFPSVSELRDEQLQQVLQQQLRLYVTGLLPSDAAAAAVSSNRAKQEQQQQQQQPPGKRAVCIRGFTGDDTAAATDHALHPAASQQQECKDSAGHAVDEAHHQASQPRRHTAQFVSVKPGPAVSAFMAQQGIQPAPDLLQAHAGELTFITLPAQLLRQQQQEADAVAAAAASTSQQADPYSFNSVGSDTAVPDGHQAKAAACLAAATDAVEAYERRKAATAASVKAGNLSAQMQVQMLCRQRARAIAAGPTKAKAVSNKVSGWLSEAGAATVCMPVKALPTAAGKAPSRAAGASAAAQPTRSTSSTTSANTRPLPTDSQCKAQRHVLENQLRAGDWRMAHAFNATLHDKCTNMAAAVAALPPPPVTPMPPSGPAAAAGQDWGALVSSSVARSHVGHGGGAASRSATGSNIKIMKAAKAIVENVQRGFAASSSPPPGKGRR